MVPSFSGHDSNTMTPPATPPTGPRSNQSHVPQTSLHSPLTSPTSQSLLPPLSSTTCAASQDKSNKNTTTTTTTMAIRVSADGVWENATTYTLTNDAPLGVGAWSSVHLAIPSEDCRSIPAPAAADTPPATPVGRSAQGFSRLTASPPSRHSPAAAAAGTHPGFASLNSIKASAVWAVKAPINKTAQTVIRSEARILSRIFSHQPQPPPAQYVVPFHGLDPQTGNLVMDALPLTLDDFINEDLSALPEPRRAALLADVFPLLAQHLLAGLDWLHTAAGVVHADIKPSNILLRPTRAGVAASMLQQRLQSATSLAVGATLVRPSLLAALDEAGEQEKEGEKGATHDRREQLAFTPLYTDFSAALSLRPDAPVTPPPPKSSSSAATTPPTSPTHAVRLSDPSQQQHRQQQQSTPSPFAAGTWEFLAPELCRATTPPPVPTPSSDVYALGITFLTLLTGASPFDAVAQGNAIRRREMIRVGDAVGFAGMDARGGKRVRDVARGMARRQGNGEGVEGGVEEKDMEKDGEKRLTAWLRAGLAKSVEKRVAAREWGEWVAAEFGRGSGDGGSAQGL
ncbi:kinase-like domain-containing protein [Phyllosticta citrichinensis]|uniref:Kinase-like domain-containing protein n=1 Tax=Phyllosticta citrichinensis TaxID=1130410 RepID=A0ABR1Y869_9PEZI